MNDVPQYLSSLNQRQQKAATITEGPLLVLAGAGSGKTRVITHRIAHLIHTGVDPAHILAITFTNKAAREMRERVYTLLREHPASARSLSEQGGPTVTTFHALGVRILREFHELVGIRKHFTIYDRADSIKAIKAALKTAGYNPKEFEPRRMLSMISRAKGDAIGRRAFTESAESYPQQVAAAVWERYEQTLRQEHALDFDDLLLETLTLLRKHEAVLTQLRERYQYLHIDEYQDTNAVQFEIARLLALEHQNICVVGDVDQCVTGDTTITTPDGKSCPIENIKKGDLVLSSYGSGDIRPAEVTRTYKKTVTKPLITITTKNGATLTSTPEHIHFADYKREKSPQQYLVYLMFKQDIGWRIGTTAVYTSGTKGTLGYIQRSNQEHADQLWIIETFDDSIAARISEYQLSLQFQIPTLPFIARKGNSIGGYVHDQTALEAIFTHLDTTTGAMKLLAHYGLSKQWPHHQSQSERNKRCIIHVSLCGDHRGKTPMHRISISATNPRIKKTLTEAGYSVRTTTRNPKSWRYENAHKSYTTIQNILCDLKSLIPKLQIVHTARLGQHNAATRGCNSLSFTPAHSVRPGMVVFTATGEYDIVTTVTLSKPKSLTVYDIDVAHTHNFIANGIVTHNSIYSWRGADIRNLLQFEKHFPGTTVVLLEENYRSTQTIIAASNAVIAKNNERIEKTVFTNNTEGERIALYAALSGSDEADYVARTAAQYRDQGVPLRDIAVLFRTNFQSRALEEAFLAHNLPYQVLGTKFFDRKEVKDVLSFLRLALNPQSTTDLARVANTPPRGIGTVTLLKLIEGKRDAITGAAAKKVAEFDAIMMDIARKVRERSLADALTFIIKRSTLQSYYEAQGTEEDLTRIENMRELVTLAKRYDDTDPEAAYERFLEDAALQTDQDELGRREDVDAVRLMTVHAAKGLEFPYVFITGLEEGLFPHERLDETRIDMEEERRLFYVALTRAGVKVHLSFAHVRMIFGSQRINVPSSFLDDIDPELLEDENPMGDGGERERTILIE